MATPHHAPDKADATPSAQTHSLSEHLQSVHRAISHLFPWVHWLTLATYNPHTDALNALVSCNTGGVPLAQHKAQLVHMPTLRALAAAGCSRVVADLDADSLPPSEHTIWLNSGAYRSSLTIPLFQNGSLSAFLFFDSEQPGAFTPDATRTLTLLALVVSQFHQLQVQISHGIQGSVQIATTLTRLRDLETGLHLERCRLYARDRYTTDAHATDQPRIY